MVGRAWFFVGTEVEVRREGDLLLLVLSVCDDVADVLVVHVAGDIWGEGGPHVLDLWRRSQVEVVSDGGGPMTPRIQQNLHNLEKSSRVGKKLAWKHSGLAAQEVSGPADQRTS